jgi:hypothetical protein
LKMKRELNQEPSPTPRCSLPATCELVQHSHMYAKDGVRAEASELNAWVRRPDCNDGAIRQAAHERGCDQRSRSEFCTLAFPSRVLDA